jgi:hypothetical protein
VKKIIALCLMFVATVSLARDNKHWIEVARPGDTIVYLEENNLVVDGQYNGYQILIYFNHPFEVQGQMIMSELSVFEIDCHTNKGRARRLFLIDQGGYDHAMPNERWRSIDESPAIETLQLVKNRVCFKANT